MLEPGSQVQNAIYLAGGAGWPVSPDDWETGARERLEQGPFDYVAGGAGSEATVRARDSRLVWWLQGARRPAFPWTTPASGPLSRAGVSARDLAWLA